jgi:hypothetical protein
MEYRAVNSTSMAAVVTYGVEVRAPTSLPIAHEQEAAGNKCG